VRNAYCIIQPKINEDSSVYVDQLMKYRQVLSNAGRIKPNEGDKILTGYKSFLDEKKEVTA